MRCLYLPPRWKIACADDIKKTMINHSWAECCIQPSMTSDHVTCPLQFGWCWIRCERFFRCYKIVLNDGNVNDSNDSIQVIIGRPTPWLKFLHSFLCGWKGVFWRVIISSEKRLLKKFTGVTIRLLKRKIGPNQHVIELNPVFNDVALRVILTPADNAFKRHHSLEE